MSFMIPLNQVESLRARTVVLIGIDRDRLCPVPGLRDGMTAAALIVPADAVFDAEDDALVRQTARAPAAELAYPLAAHCCGDDWDEERWDGLS